MNSNSVIIAPSGMLKGGAAIELITSFLNDSASAIYLIGYQVEGSPGRGLLDDGILKFKDERKHHSQGKLEIRAKCDYDYFEFSSHADSTQIYNYIENLSFNQKSIFCVHGDPKATTTLSSKLSKEGYNSVAPEIGEVYEV